MVEKISKSPDLAGADRDAQRREEVILKAREETPDGRGHGGVGEDELLSLIEGRLEHLDYPPVPSDFLPSVMNRVQSEKAPWWYRLYRWAKSQHTVRITPLKLAPVAMVLLLGFYGLFAAGLPRDQVQPPVRALSTETGRSVTFQLKMPEARSVHLVGSFNGWSPRTGEMQRSGEATWTIVLQLPAGHYEYAFLVDGTTLALDPYGEFYQDDGFGNRNNMLVVGNIHEAAI